MVSQSTGSTTFQFHKMRKFWRLVVNILNISCEYLKMVRMVNFLCILPQSKGKKKKDGVI